MAPIPLPSVPLPHAPAPFAHVNPNPNQQDYPDIQFWFKHDYIQAAKSKKSNDGVTALCHVDGQGCQKVMLMLCVTSLNSRMVWLWMESLRNTSKLGFITPLLSRRYLLHTSRKLCHRLGVSLQEDSKSFSSRRSMTTSHICGFVTTTGRFITLLPGYIQIGSRLRGKRNNEWRSRPKKLRTLRPLYLGQAPSQRGQAWN